VPHTSKCILTIGITSLFVGACDPATSPPTATLPKVQGPNLTAASGSVTTLLALANAGELHWQSNLDHFTIQLMTHDDTDVAVATQVTSVGGSSGWHYHPGPVLVLVKTGVVTTYRGDDPTCQGTTYSAGKVFIEGTEPHFLRNEGAVTAELLLVMLVPAGRPRRIDAPAPGHCAF